MENRDQRLVANLGAFTGLKVLSCTHAIHCVACSTYQLRKSLLIEESYKLREQVIEVNPTMANDGIENRQLEGRHATNQNAQMMINSRIMPISLLALMR